MITPIVRKWRQRQLDRHFRRHTADLPDYLLRDVGLERDRVGLRALRYVLHSGH